MIHSTLHLQSLQFPFGLCWEVWWVPNVIGEEENMKKEERGKSPSEDPHSIQRGLCVKNTRNQGLFCVWKCYFSIQFLEVPKRRILKTLFNICIEIFCSLKIALAAKVLDQLRSVTAFQKGEAKTFHMIFSYIVSDIWKCQKMGLNLCFFAGDMLPKYQITIWERWRKQSFFLWIGSSLGGAVSDRRTHWFTILFE